MFFILKEKRVRLAQGKLVIRQTDNAIVYSIIPTYVLITLVLPMNSRVLFLCVLGLQRGFLCV